MAYRRIVTEVSARPFAYLMIPTCAAGVGLVTNWMGVKMLFYPLEYTGKEFYREKDCPYGLFGWQGVVPARTEKMATRLTDIVSARLFSLHDAFSNVDPGVFAHMLAPTVETSIRENAPLGRWWSLVLKPLLPWALTRVVVELQKDIEGVLDVNEVVLSAFMRDKRVLVELFQRVGKEELDFLVQSGSYFGFLLGLGQMATWIFAPKPWTLPVAGALVGYATNWIAIKLLFEPAEPVPFGPVTLQGLFEKRQPEVSVAMSEFLAERVLTPPRLIDEMVNGRLKDRFEVLLRRSIPFVVPDAVVAAAVQGLRELALETDDHPTHVYLADRFDVQAILSTQLQAMPASDFENLLHPIFQEDEIILIIVGGILGAMAGLAQARLGWGGPLLLRR